MRPETTDAAQKLGQGRAAEVFLARDEHGRAAVRKVFGGDLASKLVLYLLTGAGNAYAWCESAIRSAFARRRILAHLVRYWFGDKLRLPRTNGWRWNPDHKAYEIECELIDGSHAPLRDPCGPAGHDPVDELVRDVMRPLQRHLEEAGFDGLVWQAGRGNPVAASNFMLEGRPRSSAGGWGFSGRAASADGLGQDSGPKALNRGALEGRGALEKSDGNRWVWIDCESGVPALFALNPLATLRFYLPKSLRHRRWLFDDVDVPKLRRYLWQHRQDLESVLGTGALLEVERQVDNLECSQKHWKSMPRHRRSIHQQLARGRITARQAEHYRTRPARWLARLAVAGAARCAARVSGLIRRLLARLAGVRFRRWALRSWRFATSQRYRERLARVFVAARVRQWVDRRFLEPREVKSLHRHLRGEETSAYLTDFVVHLMIKAPIKAAQWLLIPPAVALGWLDLPAAAFLMVAGGFIGRTLYTCMRALQAFARGQRRPWVALGFGLLPVAGNAAYPAQLLYGSTERSGELARFILYDTLAAAGRSVPIWGGADSLLEHWCCRLGDVAVRWLSTPQAPESLATGERERAEVAA